jgi:hypothetical protein
VVIRSGTGWAADTAIDTACRMLPLPSIRNEFSAIADRAMTDGPDDLPGASSPNR